MLKIDLGCGKNKRDGFTGIDKSEYSIADIISDLEEKLPLEDESVDEVYSSHCLEHIDNLVGLMNEIWRVCKDGAKISIVVPYYKSIGAFRDPTHRRFFTEQTFLYFDKNNEFGKSCSELYGIKLFTLEKNEVMGEELHTVLVKI